MDLLRIDTIDEGVNGGACFLQLSISCYLRKPFLSLCHKKANYIFFYMDVSLFFTWMNEKMSFKMGVKCAASFYMGKIFLDV